MTRDFPKDQEPKEKKKEQKMRIIVQFWDK